jgi:hypothetical protein
MLKKMTFIVASTFLIMGSASAAPTVGGYSSGGNVGQTYCSGVIQRYNVGGGGGVAENYTTAKGTQSARVTVVYTNSDGTRGNVWGQTATRTNDTYVQATAYADSGKTATYASATHTYSSADYGSWTGTSDINL